MCGRLLKVRGEALRDYVENGKMGMESLDFRFSMDARSKIFDFRGWMEVDARSSTIYRKSIAGMSLAGMSLAGMSLLACSVYSAGCFLGCVCGSVECAVAC